jgi:hypothetical protein
VGQFKGNQKIMKSERKEIEKEAFREKRSRGGYG